MDTHIPVLLDEVLSVLQPAPGKYIIDATFGTGGYTRALLDADCHVLAIDKDPEAIKRGAPLQIQFGSHLTLFEGAFSEIKDMLARANFPLVDGIVFDLGVSSPQLDSPHRGFSFRHDGPLDMRMARTGRGAASIVNEFDEAEIADILWRYGEERASRRIARAIIRARLEAHIARTQQLADIIRAVLPRPKHGQADSPTRTFQALRIFVNGELEELKTALALSETCLKPGGILAVVSFHSLEDRIVKQFMRDKSQPQPRSRHRPDILDTQHVPTFRLMHKKPIRPKPAEIKANTRSRSAKLRVAVRLNNKDGDQKDGQNSNRAGRPS